VALGPIANHLIEIKTRHWAMSRLTVNAPWQVHSGNPRFNRGEAIVLRYVGDIDRTFTWSLTSDDPQCYIPCLPIYFGFLEMSDYIPVFVYLPPEKVFENGGEIGLFINGVCYGASVIQGEVAQINAYILDLDIDFDTADIEFQFHQYGTRSIGGLSVNEFQVYDHVTNTFSARNLDLSSNHKFHVISLREENEIVEGITYITGIEGNFPNPFNPSTTISYSLGQPEHVRLQVFNIRGQLVRTLKDGSIEMGAGNHNVIWHGDDQQGRSVASGVYFYRLETSAGSEIRRMLLMK